MKNLSIGDQRLLQLADHLENGKLGHEVFDFANINIGDGCENGCGALGCAMGELPIVWPYDFRWAANNSRFVDPYSTHPVLKNQSDEKDTEDACIEWFGLKEWEVSHLFTPNRQEPETYGGKSLDPNATKEQVAANIRAFVALRNESVAGDANALRERHGRRTDLGIDGEGGEVFDMNQNSI